MALILENIEKRYTGRFVLKDVSHTFAESGVCLISGPSGSGKTTLLRVILGLEEPDAGRVLLPEGVRMAAVFQEDRLIAHWTAKENIALVCPKNIAGESIDMHMRALGLEPDSKTRADRLSGGMRRRVAIARAVIVRPDILLLDEPFTGLDEDNRRAAAAYIRLHTRGKLVLLVTHDPDEATLMACDDKLFIPGE